MTNSESGKEQAMSDSREQCPTCKSDSRLERGCTCNALSVTHYFHETTREDLKCSDPWHTTEVSAAPSQRYDRWIDTLTHVCSLLDGWHQDGTAWSEWDESVRKEASEMLREIWRMKEQNLPCQND